MSLRQCCNPRRLDTASPQRAPYENPIPLRAATAKEPSPPPMLATHAANPCDAGIQVTCRKCRIPMKELKGHIYHGQRKWQCPACLKIKMQKPKA